MKRYVASATARRLALGIVVLAAGCDQPPDDAAYGDAIPTNMLGRAVTVTITDSDVPTAAIPGTVLVYRFLSNTRVLGEGFITLSTQSWTYDLEAARAAECGGVSSAPYCDLYNHESWGSAGSCPYC